MELNKDALPEVTLRVPGMWRSYRKLVRSLPSQCRVEGNWLRVDAGPPVWLAALPADDQFADIFEMACRRPAKTCEQQQISQYRMNAAIVAKGGSLEAARRLLRIGAMLVESGGLGVFIDNSLMAHGASDWKDLHQHCGEPMAVYYAFVNIVRRFDGFESHGMQVMGHRDGVIDVEDHEADGESALRSFEDFLRLSCCDERQWAMDDEFHDEHGRAFRLSPLEDVSIFRPDHPSVNPYGRWRMQCAG